MMRINELMLEYRKEVIRECGSLYGFNVEEALERMNCLSVMNETDKELVVIEKKAKKPRVKKVKPEDDGVNIVNNEVKVDSVVVVVDEKEIKVKTKKVAKKVAKVEVKEEVKEEAKEEVKEEVKEVKEAKEEVKEVKVKKERKKREPKEGDEEKKKGRPKSDKPKEKKEGKKGRPKKETKEISSEGDLDDLFANLVKKSEENNSETSSLSSVSSTNDSVKTPILEDKGVVEVKTVVEEVKKEELDVVKKFEFQGTKYLKSTKSGIIYNMEQEIVGTWNVKTETIDFHEDEEEEEEEYDEDD